jgi:hypothetical protein
MYFSGTARRRYGEQPESPRNKKKAAKPQLLNSHRFFEVMSNDDDDIMSIELLVISHSTYMVHWLMKTLVLLMGYQPTSLMRLGAFATFL